MLKKAKDCEVWFHVKDGKRVGVVARVPELLRLNLISLSSDCNITDLNKWLYITELSNTYGVGEYDSFEDVKAALI